MDEFSVLLKKYNIEPKGLIQLGAHSFQERDEFLKAGIKDFVLIEPLRKQFMQMQAKTEGLNVKLYNFAVSDFTGKALMYTDSINSGMSSSLLCPLEHMNIYPEIVFNNDLIVLVHKLADVPFDRNQYNILYMDIQGSELKALSGAEPGFLNYIDAIYTEVNFIPMYLGCALIKDIDYYLNNHNFKRVETGSDSEKKGWTNAFYVKQH